MPSLKNSLFGSAAYVTHFYPTLKLRVARPNFIQGFTLSVNPNNC